MNEKASVSDKVRFRSLRITALQGVAPDAELTVSWFERWHIRRLFDHRAWLGRFPQFKRIWVEAAAYAVPALGVAALLVGTEIAFAPMSSVPSISALDPLLSPRGSELVTVFIVVLFGIYLAVRLATTYSALQNDQTKEDWRQFDTYHAKDWASIASEAIDLSAASKIKEFIQSFYDDKVTPYRIVRRFLPVPIFALRRPLSLVDPATNDYGNKSRAKHLFRIDSLSAGILHMLGMDPGVRYTDDKKMVHSVFWRTDVNELPDTDQADVFLRFHQSMVEADPQTRCRYKSFGVLNNYRDVDLLLLRVHDVLDAFALDESSEFARYQGKLLEGLTFQTTQEALDLLQEPRFRFLPPRYEYAAMGKFNVGGRVGPVLETDGNGDWIMCFDPARVWASDDREPKLIEALIVLRRAIFLASRTRCIEIVLKKRDLLLVDNRRALISRREESPGLNPKDWWPEKFALDGRWMRKIYGVPPTGPARRPDNFQHQAASTENTTAVGAIETPTLSAWLSASDLTFDDIAALDCGDDQFDTVRSEVNPFPSGPKIT